MYYHLPSYMFRPILRLPQGELVAGKVTINTCILLHMCIGWYNKDIT